MAKRSGGVVLLDEFVDEVGVDAARWYLVSRGLDRRSRSTSTSPPRRREKNPVYYVQYAHARIAGIMRNAGDAPARSDPPLELAPEERGLIKRLAEFPGAHRRSD